MSLEPEPTLDHVEELALRECLRDVHKAMKFDSLDAIAVELTRRNENITAGAAKAFVYRRKTDDNMRPFILKVTLQILSEHSNTIHQYGSQETRDFLFSIIRKWPGADLPERNGSQGRPRPTITAGYLNTVVAHWNSPLVVGREAFRGGLYQVFRRYKPLLNTRAKITSGYDWNDELNHAVICELAFLDPERMECIVITSKLDIYRGSLTLNHDDILYGIMSRGLPSKERINFRMIALKVENSELSIYSGLSLKAGDTTKRPVASECLYVRIPDTCTALYSALDRLRLSTDGLNEEQRSVFSRYVTDIPPPIAYVPDKPNPRWKRVKFVRQFPELLRLVKPADGRPSLLREPSRAFSLGSIIELSTQGDFPIFKWDD